MATKTSQRIGIWVIAVVLTVGTLAGFLVMIISPQNETASQDKLQAQSAQFQKDQAAYQLKVDAQQSVLDKEATMLSEKYFSEVNSLKARVSKFDKDSAQAKLVSADISKGSGDAVNTNATYAAYYIGWLPSGKIFDGSIDGKKLKAPLIVRPDSVIKGWSEGVDGLKIGGVRMLTIPSEKAYGETGSGADIPANTPLRFIVIPIKSLETIAQPVVPTELQQAYGQQ